MTTNIHINDQDIMRITPLGAGNEVGRSAVLVTFKGKSVLVNKYTFFYDTWKYF